MLSAKKQIKVQNILSRVLKILTLFFIVGLLGIIIFGVWKYGPQVRLKYGYLLNSSLIKPFSQEDNQTRLTTILFQANLPVISLENANEDSVVASLSGGVKAEFSLTKDLSSQVATLQVILERFRIEGRKFSRVDLRFNNAVVQ